MTKLWTHDETEPFATPWRQGVMKRVVDGDSFHLRGELGFDVEVNIYCRLLAEGAVTTPDDKTDDSVDAWETRGQERDLGKLAKARAEELLPLASVVRFRSFRNKGRGAKGKYGRWLLVILYRTDGGWRSLGDTLIEEGHAEFASY